MNFLTLGTAVSMGAVEHIRKQSTQPFLGEKTLKIRDAALNAGEKND